MTALPAPLLQPEAVCALIKVLFLAANPVEMPRTAFVEVPRSIHVSPMVAVPLRLDDEAREIEAKIRSAEHRDSLELITRWAVRTDDLLQSLNQHLPHIVHFSGHGSPDEAIYLLDQAGQAKPVEKAALTALFRVMKDNVRVVLLNACFSRPQAEAIAEHIDCAIGMNRAIGDRAAILFAASFYRAVAFGRSIRQAFEQGKTALLLEGIREEHIPELLVRPGIDPDQLILVQDEVATIRSETGPPHPELERHLLFCVTARQIGYINDGQLAEVCGAWAMHKQRDLVELLVERNWITEEDRDDLERVMKRCVKKHGNVPATLGAVADETVREVLRRSNVPEIKQSVERLSPAESPLVSESVVLPGLIPSERYLWQRLHRAGTLSHIWLGRDQTLNREVALKLLPAERAAILSTRKRFLEEAQITGQLEHPNIVPVYELGERPDDHLPFYAMRMLGGQTLTEFIAKYHQGRADGRAKAADRRRLLGVFLAVCNAVAYAHSRGVIHRDLKPDNVVLGNFGEVNLLDWGLAKILASSAEAEDAGVRLPEGQSHQETSASGRIGTPAYMAPEQADEHGVLGPLTDVYGLGAILFEILTGEAPHQGATVEEVCAKIVKEDSPTPRGIDPSVPPALDQICRRAMAKLPAERHAQATELRDDIQRWLDEEPLAAYRAAVNHFESLVQAEPRNRGHRFGWARNLINLGLVFSGMDRHEDADRAYRTAIAVFEGLVAAHPLVPSYRAELAACRLHLRNTLLALGRAEEAEQANRAALADYDQLLRANPRDPHYRSQFASALSILGHDPEEIQRRLDAVDDKSDEPPPTPAEPPRPPPPDPAGLTGLQTIDDAPQPAPGEDEKREEEQLQVGLQAMQMEFISSEQLRRAIQQWYRDRRKELGEILVLNGFITRDQYGIVAGLLRERARPPETEPPNEGNVERPTQGDYERWAGPRSQQPTAASYASAYPAPFFQESAVGMPTLGPRYQALRVLGVGGMGRVYVARDEALHREVAVKELQRRYLDTTGKLRFLLEAELTARLEHPGIVPVYSLGQSGEHLFYAMRLIQGIPMDRAIRDSGSPVPLRELRRLLRRFLDVCNAIAYAHSRGVVHRDLKPANIMLGPHGETVVLDWGLARALDRTDPAPGPDQPSGFLRPTNAVPEEPDEYFLGTPSYMSPEQARGAIHSVEFASDLYSLGATLYAILTGRSPFVGSTISATLARVRRGEAVRPRQLNPQVPRALEAICLRAMASRPEDRYPSVRALAEDVENWLNDEPVSVYRESLRGGSGGSAEKL